MKPSMRTWSLAALAVLATAGLLVSTGAARAQAIACGERFTLLQRLTEAYGERRAGAGIMNDGRLIELMVGPRGSWTLLVSRPGGATCMVASGEGWRTLRPVGEDTMT